MPISKYISDSFGTASGVACPFFGIVAGSLSLEVGGTLAIVLGSTSIFLFSAVALGFFYLTYQKNKAEDLKLKDKTQAYLTEFIENFCNSQRKSKENTLESSPIQEQMISFIQQKYLSFLEKYHDLDQHKKAKTLEKIINEFLASTALKKLIPRPPISELAAGFFMSTVGVFGAVAGTSAGMMGIFMGLGLLSGFGAVPALGLAVIVLATITALTIATNTTLGAIEKHQQTQLYKSFKQFNRSFKNNLETNQQTFSYLEPNSNASKKLNFFEALEIDESYTQYDATFEPKIKKMQP